jgi:hypothetical protein
MIFGLIFLIYLQLCLSGAAAVLCGTLLIVSYYTGIIDSVPYFGALTATGLLFFAGTYWRIVRGEIVMFAEVARFFYPLAVLVTIALTVFFAGSFWDNADTLRENALIPVFGGVLIVGFLVVKWLETPFLPNLHDSGVATLDRPVEADLELREGALTRLGKEDTQQAKTLQTVAQSVAFLDAQEALKVLQKVLASADEMRADECRVDVLKSVLEASDRLENGVSPDFFLRVIDSLRSLRKPALRGELLCLTASSTSRLKSEDTLITLQSLVEETRRLTDDRVRRDVLRYLVESPNGLSAQQQMSFYRSILAGAEAVRDDKALGDVLRSLVAGLKDVGISNDLAGMLTQIRETGGRIQQEDIRSKVFADLAECASERMVAQSATLLASLSKLAENLATDAARAHLLIRMASCKDNLSPKERAASLGNVLKACAAISSEGYLRDVLQAVAQGVRNVDSNKGFALLEPIVEKASTLLSGEARGVVLRACAHSASTIGGEVATSLLQRIVDNSRSESLEGESNTSQLVENSPEEAVGRTVVV